jgi:hypothetical protein
MKRKSIKLLAAGMQIVNKKKKKTECIVSEANVRNKETALLDTKREIILKLEGHLH